MGYAQLWKKWNMLCISSTDADVLLTTACVWYHTRHQVRDGFDILWHQFPFFSDKLTTVCFSLHVTKSWDSHLLRCVFLLSVQCHAGVAVQTAQALDRR